MYAWVCACVCNNGTEISVFCAVGTLLDTVEMFRLCLLIDCLYQQCESGVGEDRNK